MVDNLIKDMALQQIIKDDRSNEKCFDCQTDEATWASITNGIFICVVCAGKHRQLFRNQNISGIKSLSMDVWNQHEIKAMQLGGNSKLDLFLRQYDLIEETLPFKYKTSQVYNSTFFQGKPQYNEGRFLLSDKDLDKINQVYFYDENYMNQQKQSENVQIIEDQNVQDNMIQQFLKATFWSYEKSDQLIGKAGDKLTNALQNSGIADQTKSALNKASSGMNYVSNQFSEKMDENIYKKYPKVNEMKNNSYNFIGKVTNQVSNSSQSWFDQIYNYAYQGDNQQKFNYDEDFERIGHEENVVQENNPQVTQQKQVDSMTKYQSQQKQYQEDLEDDYQVL